MIRRVTDLSDQHLSDLNARFAHLGADHEARRATAHAEVVRWEWYDREAFDPRPLWYPRNLQRPGSRLPERPPLARDHVQLGFDARERLAVTLEYSGFLSGRLNYETFRTYRAGLVEVAHFHADGRPIYLQEHRFHAALIRSSLSAATSGAGLEEYEYADGRPVRITTHHAERERKSGTLLALRPHTVIEAT
jgi:hypothetical protein